MGLFILRRFAQGLITIIVVSILLFLSLHASGDPAQRLTPMDASPADVELLRERLGLDKPLHVQYWTFWTQALSGEGVQSFRYRQPAIALVGPFFLRTAELVIPAVVLAAVVGILLGTVAAVTRDSWIDRIILVSALTGQAIPIFFLSLLLVLLFAVQLQWVPVSGTGSFQHFMLPVISIAIYNVAILVRLTRAALLEVLSQDYIRTARAKGLSRRLVLARHALRNASLEVVSAIGIQLGALLSGVVVIEAIFAWPGIGKLMYDAVLARDFPLVMTGSLLIAVVVIGINMLVDLSYALLDPRIRLS
jgi:peptide/nickel transport system permease protein